MRSAWAFAALLLSACPPAKVQRPYPPPTAKDLVDHVVAVRKRVPTLKADTKTDVRLGNEPEMNHVHWIDQDIKKDTLDAMVSGRTFPEKNLIFDKNRK